MPFFQINNIRRSCHKYNTTKYGKLQQRIFVYYDRDEGLWARVQRTKGPRGQREGRKSQIFLYKNTITHLFAITAEIQGNGIEFAYKKRIYMISGSAVKSH